MSLGIGALFNTYADKHTPSVSCTHGVCTCASGGGRRLLGLPPPAGLGEGLKVIKVTSP